MIIYLESSKNISFSTAYIVLCSPQHMASGIAQNLYIDIQRSETQCIASQAKPGCYKGPESPERAWRPLDKVSKLNH